MSVSHQEVPEALGRDDHGRDGLLALGDGRRGALPEEVPGGGVRDAAELSVEGAVEEEGPAEIPGDGEDELSVWDQWQYFFHHPFRPGQGTLLTATRA